MSDDDKDKNKKEMIKLDPKTEAVFNRKGYKMKAKLNEGAFGQVYKGVNEKTGEEVAVKMMDLDKVGEKFKNKFLQREIDTLISIRHENIVYIYDIIKANNKYYIFMEFANGGDITNYLQKNGPMVEPIACYWFSQVSSALKYLHESVKIAHRDIKIDNVLLHNNIAKLTDFGFAKDITKEGCESQTYCGTKPYYSPQIVCRQPYNVFCADVWAMGVMLFCMLNNKFPFHFGDVKRMYREQTDYPNFIRGRYIKKFSHDCCQLQEKLFDPNEELRITMSQVLESQWILHKGK